VNWLELAPQLVLYGFAFTLLFIVALYIVQCKRPATNEPVIGKYTFLCWNSRAKISGLTSLAQQYVSPMLLETVRNSVKGRVVNLSKEAEHLLHDLDLGNCYAYGVRSGFKKILVLSKVDIQNPSYSRSLEEKEFHLSPYGWRSHRLISSSNDVLVNCNGRWDQVLVIKPQNFQENTVSKQEWASMQNAATFITELKAACDVLRAEQAYKMERDIVWERHRETVGLVAQLRDRLMLAERDKALRGPVPLRETPPTRLLPKLKLWQWLSLAAAFYLGYQYAVPYLRPYYPMIEQWHAGLLASTALFAGYVLYYRFLKDRLRRYVKT